MVVYNFLGASNFCSLHIRRKIFIQSAVYRIQNSYQTFYLIAGYFLFFWTQANVFHARDSMSSYHLLWRKWIADVSGECWNLFQIIFFSLCCRILAPSSTSIVDWLMAERRIWSLTSLINENQTNREQVIQWRMCNWFYYWFLSDHCFSRI